MRIFPPNVVQSHICLQQVHKPVNTYTTSDKQLWNQFKVSARITLPTGIDLWTSPSLIVHGWAGCQVLENPVKAQFSEVHSLISCTLLLTTSCIVWHTNFWSYDEQRNQEMTFHFNRSLFPTLASKPFLFWFYCCYSDLIWEPSINGTQQQWITRTKVPSRLITKDATDMLEFRAFCCERCFTINL